MNTTDTHAIIAPSELMINEDGSVYHLHIRPSQLAPCVLLMGDPGRVFLFKEFLTEVEFVNQHREFVSTTGKYKGRRVTLLSTGIGPDNIDIVLNELDALTNIDFETRCVKTQKTSLRLLRIGTSGVVQEDIEPGALVLSEYSLGLDGLVHWYGGSERVRDTNMEAAFIDHMQWNELLARPYFVRNSPHLVKNLEAHCIKGITITANGFYGPQGRVLRLPLASTNYLQKMASFRYNGLRLVNFEMESAAVAGLSALLGHEGATVCIAVAQRRNQSVCLDYNQLFKQKAEIILDALTQ